MSDAPAEKEPEQKAEIAEVAEIAEIMEPRVETSDLSLQPLIDASEPLSYPPPRMIFWETTTACNLSCRHCRRQKAETVITDADLKPREAIDLIDNIAADYKPLLVFSGGEPLIRPDIWDLAAYARAVGMKTALATNGTMLQEQDVQRIKEVCIRRVSVSLDGVRPETHDAFRNQKGSFQKALVGIRLLRQADIPVQINFSVARHNMNELEGVIKLAQQLGAIAVHVFLLVPVGCGQAIEKEELLKPLEYENLLNWLMLRSLDSKLEIRATCAPFFYRIALQHEQVLLERAKSGGPKYVPRYAKAWAHETKEGEIKSLTGSVVPDEKMAKKEDAPLLQKGCLAGTGICFISHSGEVFPCGYLPVSCGNIKEKSLREIWEKAPVLEQLRNTEIKGKCGRCEFTEVCTGCRARAYSRTGDYLNSEPFCIHIPK